MIPNYRSSYATEIVCLHSQKYRENVVKDAENRVKVLCYAVTKTVELDGDRVGH